MKNAAVNKLDYNVWECNGLLIEYSYRGGNDYTVLFYSDDIICDTFAAAVQFCRDHGATPCKPEEQLVYE